MPIVTAKSEKSSHSTGWSTMPRLTSAWLTIPVRPSTSRQAKARISALVKNGIVNSARSTVARRGLLIIPMMAEAGKARIVQSAAAKAASRRGANEDRQAAGAQGARGTNANVNSGLIQYVAGSKLQKLQKAMRTSGIRPAPKHDQHRRGSRLAGRRSRPARAGRRLMRCGASATIARRAGNYRAACSANRPCRRTLAFTCSPRSFTLGVESVRMRRGVGDVVVGGHDVAAQARRVCSRNSRRAARWRRYGPSPKGRDQPRP